MAVAGERCRTTRDAWLKQDKRLFILAKFAGRCDGNHSILAEFSCRGGCALEMHMKTPGLALMAAAALGIGAATSAYAASDRIQLAQDQSAQRQSTSTSQSTPSGGGMKARDGADAGGGMKARGGADADGKMKARGGESARGGVNVRANVGSSTSRTVVRKRDCWSRCRRPARVRVR